MKKTHHRRRWIFVSVTIVLTAVAVVFARNDAGGERGVQRRIAHLYPVHDSAFARAMGLALGPSIVVGNQIGANDVAMMKQAGVLFQEHGPLRW